MLDKCSAEKKCVLSKLAPCDGVFLRCKREYSIANPLDAATARSLGALAVHVQRLPHANPVAELRIRTQYGGCRSAVGLFQQVKNKKRAEGREGRKDIDIHVQVQMQDTRRPEYKKVADPKYKK